MKTVSPMTEPTAFDTLTAANELREAGFDRKQAEALTRVVARAHGALATEAGLHRTEEKLDTKIDAMVERLDSRIDALEKAFGSRMDALETKIGSRMDILEASVASLREELQSEFRTGMATMEARMERRQTTTMAVLLAAMSLGFGVIGFLMVG